MPAVWLLSELRVSLLQQVTAREASAEDESPHDHLLRRGSRLSTCSAIDYICPRQLPRARTLTVNWLQ